ncbi:MAG: zinc-dependent metalloprotease [Gemmatimonadota bacterium]|nr:zinc-dependent metalloprotease [Gemmatimonadota bacterium]
MPTPASDLLHGLRHKYFFVVLPIFAALTGCASSSSVTAQPTATPPAPTTAAASSKTAGLERRDGFIPILLDNKLGKIYLELPQDSMRALMMLTLATGLGSNPIGLDRGASGRTYVARFDRNGDRVLVVLENWNYRSSATNNPAHIRTVAEAFPPSTSGSLPIISQDGGKAVVDATDFFMRDWNEVAGTIAAANEGTYTVARDRSSIYRPYTKSFPENSEIDVALTFTTNGRPGQIIASIVPDGRAFTLRQHISLLKLPDDGFRTRVLDPRVGYFAVIYKDYAQPIQLPLEVRLATRHRLERVNPADPNSPIKNPIVYYIDRGIPEPIRTATREGVSWWTDAFDRAGLKGAFRVEDLPEGVDPMDARYNVVQWENRNERGWSVGGALTDPRTGEMIKGMALLDSHRARTDYNLYAGLMGADASAADTAFVLARVRQVSAHEVGHTLGLAHNYIASTYERGSVMDYPPPRLTLDASGNIDLSSAYAVGPGAYDVFAIHWGYGIFPPGTEQDSLNAIVADGLRKGFLFLSDADARPEYASDPRTNLWDDVSAMEFLKRQSDVRRVALSRFNERNIRVGEPVALLQERFVPIYLLHRFAINAVSKTIGGMEYSNAVRGDQQQATRPIDGATQRRALSALIEQLSPGQLEIPDRILALLGPRPYSYGPYVELFQTRTRPAFDELGAARTLAQLIVDAILQPERAARLVQFYRFGIRQLTLGEVIDSLTSDWRPGNTGSLQWDAMRRVKHRAVADRLLLLAADKDAAPEVRAIVELKMNTLRIRAKSLAGTGTEDNRAQWTAIAADFTRWLERRELPTPSPALRPPPGDPFGTDW